MKKILSLTMIVAMLFCFASVAFAAAPSGQIAYYDFDDENGLTKNGENITLADGVATFGEASYYTANVDLSGLTEMTVALKVKAPLTAQWAFEISTENPHAWPTEHYLGCLLNGKIIVERYSNETNRPGSADAVATANEWMNVVVVFNNDGSTVVYVNGEVGATFEQPEGYDLAIANCIGENPEFKIGKANWGDGEYSVGLEIDTLAVYNKALSADEVANALVEVEQTDAPQTGVATIALAVVAMLSGAYVVSKKH